ncbi:haloperoxidase [Actinoplanes italicus]|uniref:PAP2 superfamily protein n=1 Tax=Actinoplanes italicus TaxID=113567 RepID=A0A2T0K8D4_9ACTN|nr:vanadium-dependent haloperoxidase [Actinoplanes italicus]PRX19334.1 PAP2 superfamily protein [Actinoplanes italicus]GIE30649.1 haloperoxidase [Actinoplanes italicus]
MMRKLLVVVLSALAGAGAVAPARANPAEPDIGAVASWNGLALDAVRLTRATDADAARLYAMVNVAIYDAVNGISGTREPALVAERGPRHANPQAAAVAAAHAVLVRADAARSAGYDAELAAGLTLLHHGVDSGAAWGAHVGTAVFDARTADGSSPVESQPAGTGPGVFRTAWSGVQYRNVRPFAIAAPRVPAGPPALDSAAYTTAFAEVADLGDAAVPRPDLLATYQFWSLPAGSGQPPGEWLRIALTVAEARHLRLADEARLGALITMALADTSVVTVSTKYAYRHWRPTTAIREADTDGNPATVADPAWSARAGSVGSSPEYVSGHSSYSGAGATVLAGFFRTDRIAFTHATDSAPGGTARTYPSFSAAAAEVGRSRVYGGLHFDFSNRTGLAIGDGVGLEVLATSLLPRRH